MTQYYVFFNPDNGSVTKISPVVDNDTESFVVVDKVDVSLILQGIDPLINYHVIYNTKSKEFEFKPLTLYTEDTLDWDELIYNIPSNVNDADIEIIQDVKNKCWKILMHSKLVAFITEKKINLQSNLNFSITQHNNPNILFFSFDISLKLLANQGWAIVPFKYDFEFNGGLCSVYTQKRFGAYNYKVIHE